MKTTVLAAVALSLPFVSIQAQAQCSNATVNGTYIYSTGGSVKTGTGTATASYEEQGKLILDGNGNITGTTNTDVAGVLATLPVTGTYTIQSNCSGSATLTTTAQAVQLSLQVINGGGTVSASVTTSGLGQLADAHFYRVASATGSQCGNGSAQGAYSLLISGGTYVGTTRTAYENIAQIAFDGKGGVNVAGEVTTPTTSATAWNGTGTYVINADCTGTAQITTGSGTQNFLIAKISGNTILFQESDAATAIAGSAAPQQLQDIVPQFVFGGGWYTGLYFTNFSSTNVSFLVTFTSDAGTPLVVPGIGSSKTITLGPNDTTIVEALNSGSLSQGYASVSLPVGVDAYAVFRQSVAGKADQEAVVTFKTANSTAESLIWDDTSLTTSVAMVNPSTATANVTITVLDPNGNLIGSTTQTLAPGNKTEGVLRGFLGLSGMAGQRGSALFTVATGNVSVLGIRFGATALTTIPVTQQQ